jgi:nitrogen fixation NifU-like protein
MSQSSKDGSDLDELVQNIMTILDAEDARIYSKEVIAEFKNPSNVGALENPDGVGVADGLCNDTMEVSIRMKDGKITECRFFTDGCGATIACGSRLTKKASGLSADEAMTISPEDLIAELGGLPEDHRHCATLAVIALRNAIRNCRSRSVKGEDGGGP